MKKGLLFMCAFGICAAGTLAQESEVTTIRQETRTTAGSPDLFSTIEMDDAVPVETGTVDLRLRGEWVTDDDNDIDGDDDFVAGGGLWWGFAENLELSLQVPFAVGDGDLSDDDDLDGIRGFDGNGDINVGLLWRFLEPSGNAPAMALQTNVRFRSGYRDSDAQGKVKLIMTNDYDSGVRSHLNIWGETDDGDWGRWNWGAVLGVDGPLCECVDGTWRWIADVVHFNAEHNNGSNSTILELGAEWAMNYGGRIGLTGQFGLDNHDITPDVGAKLVYSYPISY